MTRELLSYDDNPAALRLNAIPGIAFGRCLDADRSIYFLSEACLALTDYSACELLSPAEGGLTFNDLIYPEDLVDLLAHIDGALETRQAYGVEYRVRTRAGAQRWFLEQGYFSAAGSIEGLITDISALKQTQVQLQRDAFYDKLTGLPNRLLFLDRLAQAVRRLQRDADYQFAVLFLDLDRFKVINDSLGHRAGDLLLTQVATRLEACVRPGDTVARIGGDEFTMLIDAVHGPQAAIQVAERILDDMGALFQIDGHEICSTTSIGIAMSAPGYVEAENLIRDADIALYQAKAMGKACYAIFQPGMHIYAVARLQLENDLRRAIALQEFCLLYQPIVNLESGEVAGFESFVYWHHPTRGLLPPGEFLPVAQEAGLIIAIGHWVLATACAQMALWHRRFPQARSVFVSVNLSSPELCHSELVPVLQGALARSGLDPRALKIEITEELLVRHSEAVLAQLSQVRALGVQLCIDDFGTGYSSLSYLDRLPVDFLKIDRSFVARVDSPDNLEIVRTILTLARNLGLGGVAEGVESTAQVAQLRALRCQFGQGFLFARPMEALQALRFLEQQFAGDDFTALSVAALPRLLIHTPTGHYQMLLVGRRTWSVGRAQDCAIFLPDRMVSREHAMLLQLALSNEFFWVDLGSRNGSFINFQPVTQPTKLKDGDLIRVGNRLEMQFVASPDSHPDALGPCAVLMHQTSLLQGQLWREVLMAHRVSIFWQADDLPILHTLRLLEAAGEPLPQLLLIDVRTFGSDFSAFFEALDAAFPPLPTILTLSADSPAFDALREAAIRAGAIDLIPAFRFGTSDFLDYQADLARKAARVLNALGADHFHHEALLEAAANALRSVLRNDTLF
ncbi:EAL domain-containing protein [Altericista sp. CCNU0014]|uniref:EAL domain-containing protein n=1 Tax=Altericista sp. CCNU0014 TaxID=3082949 RepID=UPI00384B35BE